MTQTEQLAKKIHWERETHGWLALLRTSANSSLFLAAGKKKILVEVEAVKALRRMGKDKPEEAWSIYG